MRRARRRCSPAAASTAASKCSGSRHSLAGARSCTTRVEIRSARSSRPVTGHVGRREERLDGVHVGVHAAVAVEGRQRLVPLLDDHAGSSSQKWSSSTPRASSSSSAPPGRPARSRWRRPAPRTRARRRVFSVVAGRPAVDRGVPAAVLASRNRPVSAATPWSTSGAQPGRPAGARARTRGSSGRLIHSSRAGRARGGPLVEPGEPAVGVAGRPDRTRGAGRPRPRASARGPALPSHEGGAPSAPGSE